MNLIPTSEIQGVKFFDSAPSCISHFENKYWIVKALSLIQSFGTLLTYALNKTALILYRVESEMDPFITSNITGLAKQKLVVCIHGLNNNPTQFKGLVDAMQKNDLSETNLFIPRVLEKGNGKLDEMVKPIFDEIVKWAATSNDKELVLVGISNGGRIARAIESEVATSENCANIKNLRFVSIVGACKGSYLANLANRLGLGWILSKNISQEIPIDSTRNQQLNTDWKKAVGQGPKRDYTFIASPHDWQVSNYDSTLMEVGSEKAKYAIIPGHGHNSIVNAVSEAVAEIILK